MTNEKYGLIGKTLVHSYSKEIHEALGRYQYQLFSLAEDAMPAIFAGSTLPFLIRRM